METGSEVEASLSLRMRKLKDKPFTSGKVIYWMSRDQRVGDNWSLLYAKYCADSRQVPLCVVFCLPPRYLGCTIRQYSFLLDGLKELPTKLHDLGIGFHLLEGYPEIELPPFIHQVQAGLVVMDFDPLIINRRWKRRVMGAVDIAVHEIDSHNIVPCWKVANRRISNYTTFRKRIDPLLDDYLMEYPAMEKMDKYWSEPIPAIDWNDALRRTEVDRSVPLVTWVKAGEDNAKRTLAQFCASGLSMYEDKSMNPVVSGQSGLSPYLHFGHISAQRVAYDVLLADAPSVDKEKFLDQLIVMKELADNFCLHTPEYDTIGAFPIWARRSLDEHRSDVREHLYALSELEGARTHDPLWNAAQTELVKIGKIHGSLRAYWAEKILEWSPRPEDALSYALYLNNRYSLDGNDPIGYTGIAMVVGGLYGRPWRSKEVIGKVKSHTYTQERLSYDVHAYYDKVKGL